jgi:hypothetical protein
MVFHGDRDGHGRHDRRGHRGHHDLRGAREVRVDPYDQLLLMLSILQIDTRACDTTV